MMRIMYATTLVLLVYELIIPIELIILSCINNLHGTRNLA